MSEPVTPADMKVHLRLPAGATGEDEYLDVLIVAARRTIEASINRTIADADLTDDDLRVVGQAIRLIAGSWYSNREAVITGTIVSELPIAVTWLLKPLRRISAP